MSTSDEPSPPATFEGSVLTTNARALVESLADLVGYEADDWDWDAVANEPGATITSVRIHHRADEALTARVETVVSMLARYQVTP